MNYMKVRGLICLNIHISVGRGVITRTSAGPNDLLPIAQSNKNITHKYYCVHANNMIATSYSSVI